MPNCRDGLRYSQYAQVSTIADRNGTGKTTTVRLLCGLDRPDSGTATIDGHP